MTRGFAQQDPVFLLKVVSSQAVHGSLQWLDNTEGQLKPSFKWLDDNLRNINRRNCPKTNEKDRRQQPLPIDVTGYMFVEKGSFPYFFEFCFRIFVYFHSFGFIQP